MDSHHRPRPPGFRLPARLLWLGVLLFGLAPQGAPASAPIPATGREEWRVGIEVQALPLSDLGDDGRAIGYAVELIRELARDRRADLVLVAKPWPELLDEFRAGRLDVLAAAAETPDRTPYMDFTAPHLVLSGAVFMRRGELVGRLDDLRGRKIGATPEGPAWEFLSGHGFRGAILPIPHLREGLRQVAERRLDAVLATRMIGYKLVREERLADIEAASFEVPGFEYSLRCAVRKGDTALRETLDLGLANLRADGTFMRIHEKWLGPYEPAGWGWTELQPFALGAAGLGVAAVLALAWQRRMLRRIAEQATELRASEERLKLVLEGGGDGAWDWDIAAGRTVRDERTAALFGYRLAELGTAVDAVSGRAHADDMPAVRAMRERLLQGDGGAQVEFRGKTAGGEWRWFLVRGRVIARDATGKPVRATGTISDITDAKRAEEERTRHSARLQEAQRLEALGMLAGGVAHDFNNLLTVILGNVGLAREELGAPAHVFLDPIDEAGQRAADLCRQMLAYAGRTTVERVRVDLSALVADTQNLLVALAGARHRFRFTLAGPPVAADGDLTQLRQVLVNFVMNAAEAQEPAGGEIEVTTHHARLAAAEIAQLRPECALAPGAYVCLEVRDRGRGIAPEAMARIFEPFFTTKFTGRGLGLAAALGIARTHGGTISVESAPAAGAVFRLWLPALPDVAPAASAPVANVVERRFTAGEVLVVDDEQVVRSTLVRILERIGFRATEADGGEAAIALVQAAPARFAVVVIDLTMPGLDGAQTLERLRAIRPGLPALLVSGYSEEEVRTRLKTGDGVAFLHKPFQLQALAEKLATVLETPSSSVPAG